MEACNNKGEIEVRYELGQQCGKCDQIQDNSIIALE